MGLTTVGGIPKDARHQELQDVKLPNGSLVQQYRLADADGGERVFEKITDASGRERLYRLDPDAARRRCGARHPSHPKQARCEEPVGHANDHFNSFFMRSWDVTP